MKIKIHFYRWTRFFSRLIQWRTFSQFSHVSIQIGDKIYEAKEWEWVIATVAKKDPPKSLVDTLEYNLPTKTAEQAERWLKTQIWKKYDYLGILMFIWRPRGYEIDNKWFCSELGAMFLYRVWIIEKPKMLLSPWALYLLLK